MNNDCFDYEEDDLEDDLITVQVGYDYDVLDDDGYFRTVRYNFECPRCHYIHHQESGEPSDSEPGGEIHDVSCDNCGKKLILVYTG